MKLYWSDRTNEPFFRLNECFGYSGEAVTLSEAKGIVGVYRRHGNPVLTAHLLPQPPGDVDPNAIAETRTARNYCEHEIEKMEEFIEKVMAFVAAAQRQKGAVR